MTPTHLHVNLVDEPVVEVVAEGHDAHLVDHVELPGAIEVEHRVEGARVAVEEVLVVHERVRVAPLHDLLVRLGGGEEAEARARVEQQGRPQHLRRVKVRWFRRLFSFFHFLEFLFNFYDCHAIPNPSFRELAQP